jgi:hypothetical protein
MSSSTGLQNGSIHLDPSHLPPSTFFLSRFCSDRIFSSGLLSPWFFLLFPLYCSVGTFSSSLFCRNFLIFLVSFPLELFQIDIIFCMDVDRIFVGSSLTFVRRLSSSCCLSVVCEHSQHVLTTLNNYNRTLRHY